MKFLDIDVGCVQLLDHCNSLRSIELPQRVTGDSEFEAIRCCLRPAQRALQQHRSCAQVGEETASVNRFHMILHCTGNSARGRVNAGALRTQASDSNRGECSCGASMSASL